jgi:hypothetical protein
MRATRRCKKRGCSRKGRSLRKRYGCFHLPSIPGVTVKETTNSNVTWLARTDPEAKEIELSPHWDKLDATSKKYIVLHERAHIEAGTDHNDQFYAVLKRLIRENHVPWEVAFELESYNCHKKH